MYDIIIIGAGPAGLTASIYARRALKKTLVLEALTYGGQIVNASLIENYPTEKQISGPDFADKLYNQAKDLGMEYKNERVLDIIDHKDYKEVITKNNTYQTKTIIIATGNENRKLNIDNEENLIGKGISYCATCDGMFYKNMEVAVVGGGNTSLKYALYLSDIASKVYLIYRRDKLKGEEIEIQEVLKRNNIEVIYNSNITKLNGINELESIELENSNNEKRTLEVKGLFVAIGKIPENENFRKLINLDDKGYIIANEDCKTNVEGIFVAGDNRTKELRQLVTAASDGDIAATQAIKYLRNKK